MRTGYIYYTGIGLILFILFFLLWGCSEADESEIPEKIEVVGFAGLMWSLDDPPETDWNSAVSYCENLSLGGYSDWRLPNIYELSSLIDYTKSPLASDFSELYGTFYWSSTKSTDSAIWCVDFNDGSIGFSNSDSNLPLCARGDSVDRTPSFQDNGDNSTTDLTTGLMWQKTDSMEELQWENASAYCDNLTLAGYNDWRLPDINELRSIINYTGSSPYIDTTYFSTSSSSYWSSTTYSSYSAWSADFDSGVDSQNTSYNNSYVRCVRDGQ